MNTEAKSRAAFLSVCLLYSVLLCGARIWGSRGLILGCLGAFSVLTVVAVVKGRSMALLLYFLPWAPMLKGGIGEISWYTLALVLCVTVAAWKKRMAMQPWQLLGGLALTLVTLLSKLVNGDKLQLSYLLFLLQIFLFPFLAEESRDREHFYEQVLFLAAGIVSGAFLAKRCAGLPNISEYIVVLRYSGIRRYAGFYEDANFYSAQITAALAGSLLLISRTAGRARALMGVTAVGLLYCGLMAVSKSFALVAGILLLCWFIYEMKQLDSPRKRAKWILAVCAAAAVFLWVDGAEQALQALWLRFSGATDLDSLTTNRSVTWGHYLKTILWDPRLLILGEGYDPGALLSRPSHSVLLRATHSTPLQILYQFGLVGAVCLTGWNLCWYHHRIGGGKTLGAETVILAVGILMPWLAIDMMFFDEFFLMQGFFCTGICAMAKKKGETEMTTEATPDFRQLARAVWKRGIWIAGTAILCAAIAFFGVRLLVTPQYEASVLFYADNTVPGAQGTGEITESDVDACRKLVDSYLVILETTPSMEEILEHAGSQRTVAQLRSMISASAVDQTELFRVTVTSPDPAEAENLARAVAAVLPRVITQLVEDAGAKVADIRSPSAQPVSPDAAAAAVLGGLMGLVASVGVTVAAELMRREDKRKKPAESCQ